MSNGDKNQLFHCARIGENINQINSEKYVLLKLNYLGGNFLSERWENLGGKSRGSVWGEFSRGEMSREESPRLKEHMQSEIPCIRGWSPRCVRKSKCEEDTQGLQKACGFTWVTLAADRRTQGP